MKELMNLFSISSKSSRSDGLKLAVICNWNQKCGISTYTKFLITEIQKLVPNVKIFSEYHPNPDLVDDSGMDVTYCWKRNESIDLLKKEIKRYNPDAIMVQHEYGVFPTVACWYNLLTFLQDYKYLVCLHSVYEHRDKFLCESPLNNIVVHTNEAANLLRKKGYLNRLEMIPHGCPEPTSDRNWNLYGTPHTLMQFGFAFDYKNFEETIRAVHLLKEKDPKYSNVYLTCYLSESEKCGEIHDKYYKRLKELCEELSIEENVALIRGFLSEDQLVEALKTNQICVLPYKTKPEHDVRGSSGASKIAMAHRIPVIVGQCHLFDDVREAGIASAGNAEEIATLADQIFSDWKFKLALINKQVEYCQQNSWAISAQKYVSFINKIIEE